MTREDFITLFSEEEMERLARAGITEQNLDEFWEDIQHEREAWSRARLRKEILKLEQRFLRRLIQKMPCSSVAN